MPRFDVALHVEVDAETASAAFADVRSHYCVVNDPTNAVTENLIDFHVDEEPEELEEGESVYD